MNLDQYNKCTVEEFADKSGLTLDQVRMAGWRGNFDSTTGNKKAGVSKGIRLIIESPKTLEYVEKLKKWNRSGKKRGYASSKKVGSVRSTHSYAQMFYAFNK